MSILVNPDIYICIYAFTVYDERQGYSGRRVSYTARPPSRYPCRETVFPPNHRLPRFFGMMLDERSDASPRSTLLFPQFFLFSRFSRNADIRNPQLLSETFVQSTKFIPKTHIFPTRFSKNSKKSYEKLEKILEMHEKKIQLDFKCQRETQIYEFPIQRWVRMQKVCEAIVWDGSINRNRQMSTFRFIEKREGEKRMVRTYLHARNNDPVSALLNSNYYNFGERSCTTFARVTCTLRAENEKDFESI